MGRSQAKIDVDDLFRRLYPPLFRYLNRLTGDPDAADDIAQEAFVRLLRDPLPEADARPWLFRVATNLLRDRARKRKRHRRLRPQAHREAPPPERPDEVVERSEAVARVRAALDRIPERDRRMLLMREEGFSYREIAEAVGVASSSVGTLLGRAIRRFREVYVAAEAGDESSE